MEIEKETAKASKARLKSSQSSQHSYFLPYKLIYFCNCIIVLKSMQDEI